MSAGLSFFPEMRSDGRGSSAISPRTSRGDDVAGARRDNLLRLLPSNVRYRIAAPAKLQRIIGRKKFFLSLFFALSEPRGALLSRNGCDNLLGSDPPKQTKVRLSKRSKQVTCAAARLQRE